MHCRTERRWVLQGYDCQIGDDDGRSVRQVATVGIPPAKAPSKKTKPWDVPFAAGSSECQLKAGFSLSRAVMPCAAICKREPTGAADSG